MTTAEEAMAAAARAQETATEAKIKVDALTGHVTEALRGQTEAIASLRAQNTAEHLEGREVLRKSFSAVLERIDEAEETNRQRSRDLWNEMGDMRRAQETGLGGVRRLVWGAVWTIGGGVIGLLLAAVIYLALEGPPWQPRDHAGRQQRTEHVTHP